MKIPLLLLPIILITTILRGSCQYFQPVSPQPPLPDSPLSYLYFSESDSYYKRVQGYEFRAEDGKLTAYFYMANLGWTC